MSKPTNKVFWATNNITDPGSGRPNKVEPPTIKKDNGWTYLEKPPFNWLNWWMNQVRIWFDWVEEIAEQPFTFAGDKIFLNDVKVTELLTGLQGLLVTGTFGTDPVFIPSGAGTRMFFYPRKAAFRAGHVSSTLWDDANIGNYSAAFNSDNKASGSYSFACGRNSVATNGEAFACGLNTISDAIAGHTEGELTKVEIGAGRGHAEGYRNLVTGSNAHAEGESSNNPGSGVPGQTAAVAEGDNSHIEGKDCYAAGDQGHAQGLGNIVGAGHTNSHILGQYGDSSESNSWFIGNGTAPTTRGLGAKWLNSDGDMYIDGNQYHTAGADFGEMFEWNDGNPSEDDRIGYFITFVGEKIKIANDTDDVHGVVSGTCSINGNNPMNWHDRWLKDKWGRYTKDVNGQREINTEWNSEQEYISRHKRPEWSGIGLVGKIAVRDDGNCEVDSYCKCNASGIAIPDTSGYRVLKRIDTSTIRILFK